MHTIKKIFSICCISFLINLSISSFALAAQKEIATFAGGCFWCLQQAMDKVPGVEKTIVGFSGGDKKNPTYKEVSSGSTGHIESVQVIYDPTKVSYSKLLVAFWKNVDPTVANKQFCDEGYQYSAAIFTHNEKQKKEAERSYELVRKLYGEVYTAIYTYKSFYRAEEYHQSYYKKNPVRYKYYKWSCGRVKRLESIWTEDKIYELNNFYLSR